MMGTRPFLIVGSVAPGTTYDTTEASKLVSVSSTVLIDRCKSGELKHTKSDGGRYFVKGEDLILFAEKDAAQREEFARRSREMRLEKARQSNKRWRQKRKANASMNVEMPHSKASGLKASLLAEIERLKAMVAMLRD